MKNFLLKKKIFFSGAVLILVCFVASIIEIIFPFVAALILAHLVSPLIEIFEKYKIPRWLGSLIITSSISAIIILFVINILPSMIDEIEEILKLIPVYSSDLFASAMPKINKYIDNFGESFVKEIYSGAEALLRYIFLNLFQLIKSFFASGVVIINILSLIFLTPIISFYALKDWPKVIDMSKKLLPASSYVIIRTQLAEINKIIHQYLKGQLIIISVMSFIFVLILYIFKIKFMLFLGLMSGLLTIIPYLGFIFSLGLILLITYSQFQDLQLLLLLSAALICAHIVESSYLTPKMLGDNIGLHPVVIIFVVMVGGLYFGLLGAVFSIPVVAILSVFIKMLIKQYLLSDYSK